MDDLLPYGLPPSGYCLMSFVFYSILGFMVIFICKGWCLNINTYKDTVLSSFGMQVLMLEDVTISAGGRDLLTGAAWRLLPGQRTGLVGVNGCGKSTLLRALVGHGDIQSGLVALSIDTEVAYLEQTWVFDHPPKCCKSLGSQVWQLIRLLLLYF